MAKAGKSSTQLLLKDARARAIEVLHTPGRAGELLVKWIVGRNLPWGCKTWDGVCPAGVPAENVIYVFWNDPRRVEINWEQSSALRRVTIGGGRFVLLGVWVSGEALETLLAVTAESEGMPAGLSGAKRYVFNRMKSNPPRKGDRSYVREQLYDDRPEEFAATTLKTFQNIAGHYRKRFELPAIPSKSLADLPAGKGRSSRKR